MHESLWILSLNPSVAVLADTKWIKELFGTWELQGLFQVLGKWMKSSPKLI